MELEVHQDFLTNILTLLAAYNPHSLLGGVLTQRTHIAGTAPIIMVFTPGTPLKTTQLKKHP
jgi:hypothetical protein